MANEISAPFSIRGVQGIQGNATSRPSVDSDARSATTRALDPNGVKLESAQGTAATSLETGHSLPPAEAQAKPLAAEVAAKQEEYERLDLKSALSEVNDHLKNIQRDLQFEVDEESNHTIVRVVDSETGDIVRQIPAEEFLRLAKRMEELDGLLMSERV